MSRTRSRVVETEMVNQRILGKRAVKRQHIDRWAVGNDELAPGVVGAPHLGGQIIDETHIHPATLSGLKGVGQLLVMSATAASIESGGDYLTFAKIEQRFGFGGATAGDSWTFPVGGDYVLILEVEWSDYTGGGTIEVEVDGAVPGGGRIGSGAAGTRGRGSIMFRAINGTSGRVKITQASGSAQAIGATMWLGISDPRDTEETWEQVYDGDVWGLTRLGDHWWTTPGAGLSVTQRDDNWAAVSSFSTSALGGSNSRTRGIATDGTDLWVMGDAEKVGRYSTAGSHLATITLSTTWAAESSGAGVGFDGSDLWLSGSGTDEIRRYSTAGALEVTTSFAALSTLSGDITVYNGEVYMVDATNSRLLVFDLAGTFNRTIDVSGAGAAEVTGVWISDLGVLYVAADGVGVFRRLRSLAA